MRKIKLLTDASKRAHISVKWAINGRQKSLSRLRLKIIIEKAKAKAKGENVIETSE
jgi:hypothetical protein